MKSLEVRPGIYTVVDDQDWDYVKQFTWSLNNGYVCRRESGRTIFLQKELLPGAGVVRYVDGNKLNNTRENLVSGPESLFWSKVNKDSSTGCWLWTGSLTSGYGSFLYERKTVLSHRLSWYLTHGFWPPPDKDLCHKCDVRKCVNPDHLFVGTRADNMHDMISKGRHKNWGGRKAGPSTSQSKITQAFASAIRCLRATGKYSQKELGAMFGLSQSSVSDIANYVSYVG